MSFLELDDKILLAVNGLHAPWADTLMWTVSGRAVWIPLYLLLAYILLRHEGWRRTLVWLAGIALVILISDQTCIHGLRQVFCRPRPCNLADNPIAPLVHVVNDYRSGRYGFPSAHAANTAALVCYLHLILRRRWLTTALAAWCALVCYSRMYLGVHYMGDLLGGACIGCLSAVLVYTLIKKYILPRLLKSNKVRKFAE